MLYSTCGALEHSRVGLTASLWLSSLAMTFVGGGEAETRLAVCYILPRRAVGRIARRRCVAAHPARSVFRTAALRGDRGEHRARPATRLGAAQADGDRKSTRRNSSH